MSGFSEEIPAIRQLRRRGLAEGGVFWADENQLCVFDPEAAARVNEVNYRDLTLPDRLVDLLRRRPSPRVSWKEVRAAWVMPLRRMTEAEPAARLAERMADGLDERLGQRQDLMWVAQEVSARSMLPAVVDGLPAGDLARVLRDQDFKLHQLLATERPPASLRRRLRSLWTQFGAGLAVRRELRGRAKGRRPRRLDLADPIVDMLPRLGMDRATDAITAVLTAIAGPPGCAASCLLYELVRRPEWRERLEHELAPLTVEEVAENTPRNAPLTHRFVKEVLRAWSPPTIMTRPVRAPVELDGFSLEPGQRYLLSPFFIHRDPRHWKDPDVFDPDRWLPDAERGACPAGAGHGRWVPFGWAPKSCIGAALGTLQLTLLTYLVSTRYRVEAEDPEAIRMVLAGVAMPLDFHGSISRR